MNYVDTSLIKQGWYDILHKCHYFPTLLFYWPLVMQRTWERLRSINILHDAIPHPYNRVGHPMHIKVIIFFFLNDCELHGMTTPKFSFLFLIFYSGFCWSFVIYKVSPCYSLQRKDFDWNKQMFYLVSPL